MYFFTGQNVQALYGQKLRVKNTATGQAETIELLEKKVFPARRGLEGYGMRAVHSHTKRGQINAFLKIFQHDIPERHPRSEFLVKLGLARHHEWIFQGVPYAWLKRRKIGNTEIVAHLTRFIGLQYGAPAEDFGVLRDDGKWDEFTTDERRAFAAHLACAVSGLERLNIVHGDLSPGNIMIGPGPGHRPVCVLCDFDGFYHPSQPLLPRKFNGELVRPIGTDGYQYPELLDRIATDKDNSDETIKVDTDRFALGALICEMMAWRSDLTSGLGRPQLLTADITRKRKIPAALNKIRKLFPDGFALLEQAMKAGSPADMPTPEKWLGCLGVPLTAAQRFASAPYILFFRGTGHPKALHRRAVLTKPSGSFGMVDAELADINFARDDTNELRLTISTQLPTALQREGRQRKLAPGERADLAIAPEDALHIGDWEIVFKESSSAGPEEISTGH